MRSIVLVAGALALGCGSKKAEPAAGTGSASASESGTGSASASAAPAKPDAHPMPAAMLDKLKPYGAPHGTPIYVPPNGKEPEHWLAFVGGEAAMSAWLVTPSDSAHLIGQIGEWPTALKIDGAHIEVGPHGLPGNDGSTFVWLLATSLPGMGQPGGLHGVVRVGIDGAQYANSVSTMEDTLVPLAGVTSADDIGKKIDPVSAEMNRTMNLLSDDAQTQLGTTLADPKITDDALAALIPKDGFGVATAWQGIFVKPTGHGKTPAELRALIQGKGGFTCNYITCDGAGVKLVLGEQDGKAVIRDVLVAPAAPIGAGTRKLVPPSATTAVTDRTLRETGVLDAKVIAEAPYGDRGGTIGVATNSTNLIARDGDYVITGSVPMPENPTAAMLRFVDVDGDGRTDVAVADTTEQGATIYYFATVAVGGHDLPAGMAALGAKDLDDAVARALALDQHPVTAAQACALLTSIKSKKSLEKAGPHARVLAFEEPGEPEVGGDDMGKDGAHAIHDAFTGGCELDCDATRPECERPAMGPDTDYFLFQWNGDKLELALAMIYMGA